MVANVMSLTGSGTRDWLVQRVSAIVFGLYILFLLGFIVLHPNLRYEQWHALFAHAWMRIISAVVLLNLILHAWIGIWRVTTDYMTALWLRMTLQILIVLALLSCFVWGIDILWSV